MRKLISTILVLSVCLAGRSQFVIQEGAGVKATGDVQITFDNINIGSDDTTSDFSGAVFHFKGSTGTSIGGTGKWMIKKIILDKTGSQLGLSTPIQVTGQVQFINGLLFLNAQTLILSPGATLQDESENSRIYDNYGGTVQTTIPLNMPNNVNAGNLGATITSTKDLGSVTIKRWHHPDNNSAGKVLRFYELVLANNTALNATLRLSYFDAELIGNPEPSLVIYTRNSTQNNWSQLSGATRDAAANYVEKAGLASLQQYSIGSGNIILPLTWAAVSAACKKGTMEIKWSTVQEAGISSFKVQRSTNGTGWTSIASVPASGNTTTPKSYSYNDASAPSGSNLFYRIAAVESNAISYSSIAAASPCKKDVKMHLAPVPAFSTTSLTVYSDEAYKTTIKLLGTDGRIHQQREVTVTEGASQFQFDLNHLAAGAYYVQIGKPDGTTENIAFLKR